MQGFLRLHMLDVQLRWGLQQLGCWESAASEEEMGSGMLTQG